MSYDFILNNAVRLFEDGQLDKAEQLFRQILETAPEQPDVLNLLGLVAQAKGAHQEACRLFYQAIMQKNDNPAFYYNLAFSLKYDGKPYEALENFQKSLSLKPDTKEAYYEIALLYKKLGNLEQAKKFWVQALNFDSEYVDAKVQLALCGNDEDIECSLKEIEAEFPQSPLPLYHLSLLYFDQDKIQQALDCALKAEVLAPNVEDIQVLLGQIFLSLENNESAKKYFETAVRLDPYNIRALIGLADVCSRLLDYERAEQLYRRALELDKTDFNAHQNYAEMLFKQKRKLEALEEYRQAVILNPRSAALSNNLGVVLRDCQEYEQACGLFFNAMSLAPDFDAAALNAVETLLLLYRENADDALKIAENWYKQMPDNLFARHIYNSLKGNSGESDLIYNQRLFESFADNYELVMSSLGYAAPMAVGRIAGSLKGSIVDLGCGTGLIGQIIKTSENILTGVDLSSKMLEKAQEKAVYSDLICEDIVSFLKRNKKFDWAVAADVLGYLGALEDFFAEVKGIKLVFTTEKTINDVDFCLQPNGRYQHQDAYVESLLRLNGYVKIQRENIVLRQENGDNVRGSLWRAE